MLIDYRRHNYLDFNQDKSLDYHEKLYIAKWVNQFIISQKRILNCRNCKTVIGEIGFYDKENDFYNPYLCDCGKLSPIDFHKYGYDDIVKICIEYKKDFYQSIDKPNTVSGYNEIGYIKDNVGYIDESNIVYCLTCETILNPNDKFNSGLCRCGVCNNIYPESIESFIKEFKKSHKSDCGKSDIEIFDNRIFDIENPAEIYPDRDNPIVIENFEIIGDLENKVLRLPGQYESYHTCGKVKFAKSCSQHCTNDYQLIYHNCGRMNCPICFHTEINRKVSRAHERVFGMKKAYQDNGINLGRIKHIVFSPPQDETNLDDLLKDNGTLFKKKLYRLLKEHSKDRVYGGVIVIHPWRKKHNDDKTDCDKNNCERKHFWEKGLHVHYIGFGYFDNSKNVYEKTGWVYKRIKDKKTDRKFIPTMYYLLTHCGIFEKKKQLYDCTSHDFVGQYEMSQIGNCYHYCGYISNCKGGFKIVDTRKEIELCERCKAHVHKYGVIDDKIHWDWDQDESIIVVTVKSWYVYLEGKRKFAVTDTIDFG